MSKFVMVTWQRAAVRADPSGDGFVACKGGTGTLVELAVVWEMLNKSVMRAETVCGARDFWHPILERFAKWKWRTTRRGAKRMSRLVHVAATPDVVAQYLCEA